MTDDDDDDDDDASGGGQVYKTYIQVCTKVVFIDNVCIDSATKGISIDYKYKISFILGCIID